jgi:flavin reductase
MTSTAGPAGEKALADMRASLSGSEAPPQAVEAVEPEKNLRTVMRRFATGVCVVTTYADEPDGRRHDAVTMNSLTSVSLDPPLVSFCLRRDSRFLSDLLRSAVWGVSILDVDGESLARTFAGSRDARAAGTMHRVGRVGPHTGALLYPAAGWLECAYRSHQVVGDHVVVIGEVLWHGVSESSKPLIFLHGDYHSLDGTCHA